MNSTASRALIPVFLCAVTSAVAAGKPIALVGDQREAMTVRLEVADRIPVKSELVARKGSDLRSSAFTNYAAIVFCDDVSAAGYSRCWNTAEAYRLVREFVEQGGALVLTGKAVDLMPDPRSVRNAAELFAFGPFEKGKFQRLDFGKGAVYACRESLAGLIARFRDEKKPLGIAGGAGEWNLTAEGEEVERLKGEYRRVLRELKGVDTSVDNGGWGAKPLGANGKYPRKTEVDRHPAFAKTPPKYQPGLTVASATVTPVILHSRRFNDMGHFVAGPDLAKELAWHIEKMCGVAPTVREYPLKPRPKDDPAEDQVVIFVDENDVFAERFFGVKPADHPIGTSIIRRKGNWILLGGNHSGASHAVTYVLEQLGCRYLWPSEDGSGVVVPTGLAEVRFPEIDRTFAPEIKHRGIRSAIPNERYFADHAAKYASAYGVTNVVEFRSRLQKTRRLAPTGRDFFAWHGVGDRDALDGDYMWGEYYKDYWDRYHKTHPEFFALQPNGSREVTYMKTRPRLCLSNRGLVEETAKNLCERFEKLPSYNGLPITLADAGGGYQCMCEACRRLDPPNAKIGERNFGDGVKISYPAPTDRLVWFGNEVIRLVHERHPGKKICFYAYNAYTSAPVANVPDKDLVVLTTSGDYTKGSSALGNFASWSRFGIAVYWRPNLLWGYRTVAPQNFARKLFNDVETLKVNGCEGTDFDCYYDNWAAFGFIYYMLAKSLTNVDHLDFDTIADDYFASAFGPAASAMKRYWAILERHFDNVSKTPRTSRYGFEEYSRNLDLGALRTTLKNAIDDARGNDLVRRRIRFFARGLYPAQFEQAIVRATDAGDTAAADQARESFREWLRTKSTEDLPSTNPYRYSEETPCLR